MTFFIALFSFIFGSSPVEYVNLHITIDDVRIKEGQMIIKFYQAENDFLGHDTYKLVSVKATTPSTNISVSLPKGRYAIALYHDIDMSGNMNKNFVGMPQEPVGISNDAIKGLSKPTFEDASFELKEDLKLTIDLMHF